MSQRRCNQPILETQTNSTFTRAEDATIAAKGRACPDKPTGGIPGLCLRLAHLKPYLRFRGAVARGRARLALSILHRDQGSPGHAEGARPDDGLDGGLDDGRVR